MTQYAKSLFFFRRDLRLQDNTALLAACEKSSQVLCVFNFDPRQIDSQNEYRGNHFLQFLAESLADLSDQIGSVGGKLRFLYGLPQDTVKILAKTEGIDAVFWNRDYTPFAKQRDFDMKEMCANLNVACETYHDALLIIPESVTKEDGKPYTIFTPFYKKILGNLPAKPQSFSSTNISSDFAGVESGREVFVNISQIKNPKQLITGGRKSGLELLKRVAQLDNYQIARDVPSVNGTTYLSAHHRLGTISIRETYYTVAKHFGVDCTLIRELYWRDFFTYIAHHFPQVYGHAFQSKYENIAWEFDESKWTAWCNGTTGFPIVDAGMRQLNATGYMHNRVRMIVASFLTKDLHIDWRLGEKYFAQQLLDYDSAVNNGSWQWAASTGCDAQPYFRIFNPWLQQKRFDPECSYIKKWIPELQNVSVDVIHNLENEIVEGYPQPIVIHSDEKGKAIAMFKGLT